MNKVFRLIMPVILVITLLLTACSSSNDGGSSATNKSDKPVELVLAFLNVGVFTDLQKIQGEINKITLEKMNATVKLMPIDSAAWNQQINLLLAGSEPLDLVVSSAYFNYSNQVTKGQLIPLDDLLNEYGAGIIEAVPPAILAGTKLNGQVYGIPSVRDYAADYGYIARKDIIDKHNIDLQAVKTFEDLTSVFATLAEKEPDLYPIVQRSTLNGLAIEMVSGYIDGVGNMLGTLYYSDDSTTFFNQYETDMYRQYVELAHQWYKAGYLPADSATTQESHTAFIKANKAVGYFSNFKPGFENQEVVANGYEMVAVRITEPTASSSSSTSFMMSIAKNSKYPDKAMQLLNLMYSDKDIMNLLSNGIEGVHYVQVGDGTIKIPEGVSEQTYLGTQWLMGNNALAYPWQGTDPDIWEQMTEFNNKAKYSKAVGFVFDTTNVKTEVASIQNVLDEYRPGIESGTLNPSVIDEFNEKLKAAGLDRMIEEKQKQFDAWLNTK